MIHFKGELRRSWCHFWPPSSPLKDSLQVRSGRKSESDGRKWLVVSLPQLSSQKNTFTCVCVGEVCLQQNEGSVEICSHHIELFQREVKIIDPQEAESFGL